jgi:hypothetical protein
MWMREYSAGIKKSQSYTWKPAPFPHKIIGMAEVDINIQKHSCFKLRLPLTSGYSGMHVNGVPLQVHFARTPHIANITPDIRYF